MSYENCSYPFNSMEYKTQFVVIMSDDKKIDYRYYYYIMYLYI